VRQLLPFLGIAVGIIGIIIGSIVLRRPVASVMLPDRATIFLARLRDWDNSLSGGLPDDMRAELDDLLKRAGVRQLPKGDR
jgi:hypothetical protein